MSLNVLCLRIPFSTVIQVETQSVRLLIRPESLRRDTSQDNTSIPTHNVVTTFACLYFYILPLAYSGIVVSETLGVDCG